MRYLFSSNGHYGFFMVCAIVLAFTSCTPEVEKPDRSSEAYRTAVSDFFVSLAAIQSDRLLFAVEKMEAVTDQYPQEAAGWANLSVFSMRQGDFDMAESHIGRALDEAPGNAEIIFLAGIIQSRRGNINESVDYLQEAAAMDSTNPKIAFALAEELERQDEEESRSRVFDLLESLLEQQPDNLAVLLELVRTSVKWENRDTLERAMGRLSELSANWPADIQRQFNESRQSILEAGSSNPTFQLAFLSNSLNQLPKFQGDLAAIQIPPTQVGFLITDFAWLPQPETSVAPKDDQLGFTEEGLSQQSGLELAKPISLSDRSTSDWITVKNGMATVNDSISLEFPGSPNSTNSVITIDYDYDFLNDLVFAGSAGLKIFQQQADSSFSEITTSAKLPANYTQKAYYGGWARDVDLDGDLDLVMSPQKGPVEVLRNNGDGTFSPADLFGDISGVTNFLWADLDADLDADPVFLSKDGQLLVMSNERSGMFRRIENIPAMSGILDVEIADIDSDADFELLAWHDKGVSSISYEVSNGKWKETLLVALESPLASSAQQSPALFAADLDNNGGTDIMASAKETTRFWLSDENLSFSSEAKSIDYHVTGLADFDGDTRLDITSLDNEGNARLGKNTGGKEYLARIIRPRASGTLGDQRINSFGIGGEIEIRSGLLYQKQQIEQPWVHLGLGTYEEAEVLRIIWPNGSSQAEFAELGYDTKIFNEQILKGSCPWVFTYNGDKMEFVTDFLWRTGLGIRINAQGDADAIHSIDWVKISEDQLKPRNGYYDVRITADLWETHFFDHVSLMAVDHPEETEILVDERFTFPPKQPELFVMDRLKPVHKVVDQNGRDVTELIRNRDRKYVDTFEMTKYQGIAQEHYVEIDLGEESVKTDAGQKKLVASGWVYPTDTSINIAISQGDTKAPHPVRLEVPDGEGGWKVVRKNIGFPAGKSKTMVIDITDIFEPGTEHRLRLVTNMEIYWNQFQWGLVQPDANVAKREIDFSKAELRYRGYSKVDRPSRLKPEIPNYEQISGTTPKWGDLRGFYTRFGPVDSLLNNIDDRYVIMNAGDELRLQFPELSPTETGYSRDFVLIGDGWVKDGDYNTGFSTTVLPLPYHGMEDYSDNPGSLADDPVYQRHTEDWVNYHTRYVTPQAFRKALVFE